MKSCKKIVAIVLMLMLVLSSFILVPANAISTNNTDNTEIQQSAATPDEAKINTDVNKKGLMAAKALRTSAKNYLLMYYSYSMPSERIAFTEATKTNNTAFASKADRTTYTYPANAPIELFLIGYPNDKKPLGNKTPSYSEAIKNGFYPAFCVYPGKTVSYNTNTGYKLSNFNNYYNKLKPSVQKALKTLSAAGVPGKYNIKTGSINEREMAYATQLLYWEFITGHRSASDRTTEYYADTDCNFSKRIKNIGDNKKIKVADIQTYYNKIVAEMKRIIKSETAKGKTYDKREGSNYTDRMGEVENYATSMDKAHTIYGYKKSSTDEYKYVYYATIKNFYNSDGSKNYTDCAIVNKKGGIVSGKEGSGKPITVDVKQLSDKTTARIDIKSRSSFKAYEDKNNTKYYLTFKQKAPTVGSAFGANKTASYEDWQNVVVRFPYTPTKFYARIYSKAPKTPTPEQTGQISIQKTCRKGIPSSYKSYNDAEAGWYFLVEGDSFGSNGKVVRTDDKGIWESENNLKLDETYKVTELGRLLKDGDEAESSPKPVTINGKKYGFPKGWSPREADSDVKLVKSKKLTSSVDEYKFTYVNYYAKQEFRVLKESDDGDVKGYYFKVYDSDNLNDHLKTKIVGPTDKDGYTDIIEVDKLGTFKVGVKEIGKYKSGDKSDENSYEIPDRYDPPKRAYKTLKISTAEDDDVDQIPIVVVENHCSGYIQIKKSGEVPNTDIVNPVSGAVYGIYKAKIFKPVEEEPTMADDDATDGDEDEPSTSEDITVADDDSGEEDTTSEDAAYSDDGPEDDNIDDPDGESSESSADEGIDDGGDDIEDEDPAPVLNILDSKKGNLIQKLVTNKNGISELSDALDLGTYYVQEISAPKGTYFNDKIYKVKITAKTNTKENPNVVVVDAVDTLTYVDFYKVDENGYKVMTSADTDVDISKVTFVEGATIQVLDEDGQVVYEWNTGNANKEIIGQLEVGKTYTFHESVAPDGYAAGKDITFTIPNNPENIDKAHSQFVMVDTIVDFTKYDASGEKELEGAEIVVKDKDGNIVDQWTSTTEAHKIKGLVEGQTYTLEETIAPEGYTLSAEKIEFTVNKENQHLKMTDSYIDFTKYKASGEEELEGAEIVVKDERGEIVDQWTSTTEAHIIKGLVEGKTYTLEETVAPDGYVRSSDKIEFTVTKENQHLKMTNSFIDFTKFDASGTEELEGAEIVVKDEDGEVIDTWTSTKEPHIIKGLIEGNTYTLEETVAPEGYTLSSEKITFVPGKEDQHLTMTDNYVDFTKYDATGKEELEGAHIAVYDKDNNEVDSWTSTKEPHIITGLIEGQTYILKETIAPKGYTLNSEEVEFTVGKENMHLSMTDSYVTFTKTDLTGEKELEGAKIVVKDEDGKVVDRWTSTKEPHYIKHLVSGQTYYLTERVAPEGYNVSAETIKFKVTNDENQDLSMKDSVTDFIKYDNENRILVGATIKIYDSKGNKVDEFTTDKKPHIISGLKEGETYTVHEAKVPDSHSKEWKYKYAPDKTFTVNKKENTHVTMIDDKIYRKTSGNYLPWILGFSGLACALGALLIGLISRKRKYNI